MALRDAVALVSLGFGGESLQHHASFAELEIYSVLRNMLFNSRA